MKISLLVIVTVLVGSLWALEVVSLSLPSSAFGEYVPTLATRQSPITRHPLFKRSLCNTFGGCGTKRSIMPHSNEYSISDETSEEQRYDADTRKISEILEDIIEHLKRDQNYQQGKYVMYVPKRVKTSEQARRARGNSNHEEADAEVNRQSIRSNGLGELRVNSEA